jgi:chemotaxis protein methyltransferase CheR
MHETLLDWSAFRRLALPWLRTHPSVRIWLPEGAAEAFRLADILLEEGLGRKARIYATGADAAVLEAARTTPSRLEAKSIVLFFQHSLATDASPNEFQAVLSLDALAGLDADARAHGSGVLADSVGSYGVLGLGANDPSNALFCARWTELEPGTRLYRRGSE